MKIRLVGGRIVPCGRTGRHDEANSGFSQFFERAKKIILSASEGMNQVTSDIETLGSLLDVRVLSPRKFSYTPNGHVPLLPTDFTTSGGVGGGGKPADNTWEDGGSRTGWFTAPVFCSPLQCQCSSFWPLKTWLWSHLPPYTADQTPRYFILFPRMRSEARGRRFWDVSEIQKQSLTGAHAWLQLAKSNAAFSSGRSKT